MESRGPNVRLTAKAHDVLTKQAKDSGFTMKEVASVAVMSMFSKKREDKLHQFTTFALGAITSGALMFFVGMLW